MNQKPNYRRQFDNVIETQIARYPLLVQLRAVWRQLQDERESWSLVLPVTLLIFLITYRMERKRIKALLRDLRD